MVQARRGDGKCTEVSNIATASRAGASYAIVHVHRTQGALTKIIDLGDRITHADAHLIALHKTIILLMKTLPNLTRSDIFITDPSVIPIITRPDTKNQIARCIRNSLLQTTKTFTIILDSSQQLHSALNRHLLNAGPIIEMTPVHVSASLIRVELDDTAKRKWEEEISDTQHTGLMNDFIKGRVLSPEITSMLTREAVYIMTGHGPFAKLTSHFYSQAEACCTCEEGALQTAIHCLIECHNFDAERTALKATTGWTGNREDVSTLILADKIEAFNFFSWKIIKKLETTNQNHARPKALVTASHLLGITLPWRLANQKKSTDIPPITEGLTASELEYVDSYEIIIR